MFIKTTNSIIDLGYLDGFGIEESGSEWVFYLYKLENLENSTRLMKIAIGIEHYGREQAVSVLGQAEKALIDGEKMFVLPKRDEP